MIYLPNRRKYFAWDLSNNTVLQYKCNDNAANTTVTDEEGTNGTSSTNTSNLSTTGKINEAFEFNGSNEYVDCNQTLQTTFRSDFSLCAWVKINDGQPADYKAICGAVDGSFANAFQLYLTRTVEANEGRLVVQYKANSNEGVAMTNDQVFINGVTPWIFLTVVVTSTQIYIYVNAVQQTLDVTSDGDMSSVTMGDYTNAITMYIGARNQASNLYFDGLIDDFRIHDRVLTQAEINGIYQGGSGTERQSG
jgi:hypothetical protein